MIPGFGIAKLQSCIGIGIFLCCPTSLENINFEHKPAKIIQKSLKFGSKFGFGALTRWKKCPIPSVKRFLFEMGFRLKINKFQKQNQARTSPNQTDGRAHCSEKIFFRRQPSEFLFFLWYGHLLSFTPQRLVSRQVLTTIVQQQDRPRTSSEMDRTLPKIQFF